jgi:hypothetical protein
VRFIIKYYLGDLIEGDEMGRSRDTQGTEEKCIMEFGANTSKKERNLRIYA